MKTMLISLRPGQRIYMNGAVIRADRKVTLELLNDATFLLESHVLQPEETTTPLRQLYYVVQTMLIDPSTTEKGKQLFSQMVDRLRTSFQSEAVLSGLNEVAVMVGKGRNFDALRAIRGLFPHEAAILIAPQIARAA